MATREAARAQRPERTPYSREATSLLDQIAERALDDDYYVVRAGRYSRSRGVNTLGTGLMIAVFALMVTVTAVQSHLDSGSRTETRQALGDDVAQAQAQQSALQSQVAELDAEIAALRGEQVVSPEELAAQIATGVSQVRGDGVLITIIPAEGFVITGAELRALVNELWIAGAEAISVNGQRWGALTSLRTAGGAVTVNFTSIGAPYVISVLGDRDALVQRLEASGEDGYWKRRQNGDELTYSLVHADDQVLPSAPAHRTSITRASVAPADEGAS